MRVDKKSGKNAGFTLLEVMVVLVIMGLIVGTVSVAVFSQLEKAKIRNSIVQIRAIEQALDQYRQKMGIDARLIVVGMTANNFTIADPNDAGMLDVVGFDTAAPNIMASFANGEF